MRKRRAIVYDDDMAIISFFRDFFSSRGYEVLAYQEPVVCPLSRENEESCDRDRPCADVMISDYQMPRINGLKLIQEQVRNGCRMPKKNKAVMTGLAGGESEFRMALQETGCAFFQKPVVYSELSDWITDCELRIGLSQPLATRRKEMRHQVNYEMQCLADRDQIQGAVIDVSDNGLRIRLAAPVEPAQTIHIETKFSLIACRTASVRWISKNPDGSYHAGLLCY
ncbi:MAG TPA: response regulator [Nitrospirota bacterium]